MKEFTAFPLAPLAEIGATPRNEMAKTKLSEIVNGPNKHKVSFCCGFDDLGRDMKVGRNDISE